MARVLIVDDEESIRTTLRAFAQKDGHTVSLAGDAMEALEHLANAAFDVVVSDIILPRKSGVELLAEIREAQPDVQVIMVTGEPEVVTAAEAVRRGAFDYLSKPVSREAITKVVAAAAEKKALLDRAHLLEEENQRYREHLEQLVDERTGELRTLATRYETLFGSIADPVFVFDQETHHFLDCNQAALDRYGYRIDELKTMTPVNLHPPAEREEVHENIVDVRDVSPHKYLHITKDGSEFPVEVHTSQLDYDGIEAWISIVRDITERRQAERQVARLLDQQRHINELSLALGDISDLEGVFSSVYRHVVGLMDASSFIVSYFDEDERTLNAGFVILNDEPFDAAGLPPIPLNEEGAGSQSRVVLTGRHVYHPDYRRRRGRGKTEYAIDDDGEVSEDLPPEDAEDYTRSALLVPLKVEGKTIGVMQTQSYKLDAYSQEDIALLAGLANVAAVAIANARLVLNVRSALESTIQVLAEAVELRDPYTAGHQKRVAALAVAIAERLDLPAEEVEAIQVAGFLHDIGKMAIPAEILSKPTRLSEAEYALIRAHPQVAYELLDDIAFPWPVADIVHQHHEKMDGSGYPQGLQAEDIRIESRILAVSDVVEAMSSHRPYRPALGIKAALAEIKDHRRTHFDSGVVDACVELFETQSFEFPQPQEQPSKD